MRKPSIGGSGTADSRQAWLDEVQRRARLGEDTASFKHVTTMNKPTKPPIERKVTGKPSTLKLSDKILTITNKIKRHIYLIIIM
ncbi:hypothetical protein PSHT_07103 [Puccinia striiformis]|uniref:Uncharacterized protein n=1 Tax=Puccinia striiformis TaxID=27350 RepID=A0A2S4W0Z2_9BASI|nr:hypothetical protein PSHT_07103 [Puccinia striiformis]